VEGTPQGQDRGVAEREVLTASFPFQPIRGWVDGIEGDGLWSSMGRA
jgi:hypothetical protein